MIRLASRKLVAGLVSTSRTSVEGLVRRDESLTGISWLQLVAGFALSLHLSRGRQKPLKGETSAA